MDDLHPLVGADTFPHARKPTQPSAVDLNSSRAPCPCASAPGSGSHISDAENGHAALHPLSLDCSQFDAGFTIKAHSSVRELGDAVRESDEVTASAAGAGALEDDASCREGSPAYRSCDSQQHCVASCVQLCQRALLQRGVQTVLQQ